MLNIPNLLCLFNQFLLDSSFKVVNFTDDSGKTYTRGAVSIDNNLLIIKVQRSAFLYDCKKLCLNYSIVIICICRQVGFCTMTFVLLKQYLFIFCDIDIFYLISSGIYLGDLAPPIFWKGVLNVFC